MAVIRGVKGAGSTRVQAIVRKGGHSLARTFGKRRDAVEWARDVEHAIDRAGPHAPFVRTAWLQRPGRAEPDTGPDDLRPRAEWGLGHALEHYGKTVSVRKKGAVQEQARVAAIRQSSLASIRLDRLTAEHVQGYVERLGVAGLSNSTVRLRVMLLRALYRDARIIWKLALPAVPFGDVVLPAPAPHRTRRFQDGDGEEAGEEARLRTVIASKPSASTMLDLLDLAIATGMRQSELLGITAEQVKRVSGVDAIEQPDSKSGDPRHVILSTHAAAIVKRRAKGKRPDQRLFSWTPADLRQRWNAARKEAGLHDFRWHDLRHEGLSRMGAAGMHVGMLMGQSGHRTVATLKRYLNPTPKEVKKLLG